MIIVNLKGGLGNQMFQYAFGRAYSLKNNVEMKLDVSGYPLQTLRSYGLAHFNIQETLATPEEIKQYKYPYGFASKIWRGIKFKIFRKFYKDYHTSLLRKKDRFYADGFFQSEKYFTSIRTLLLQEFTLTQPLSKEGDTYKKAIQNTTTSISLHVRRGDYAANPHLVKVLGFCSEHYYVEAVKQLLALYPEATFFVFSDDIAWVKEHISLPASAQYISNPALQDYEELYLMSLCHHNIIANSSFSWWGAWLNQNPDKHVIAPLKWTNSIHDDHPNIIPPSWTQIPN